MKKVIKKSALMLIICLLIIPKDLFAFSPDKQKQIESFRNAKFGMFIHWGVYSMIGRHEWVRDWCEIPIDEYQYYVDNFNPVDYNPDEWVDLAKEAGMKYMVITSKHHDGYCLFDSKLTDYDIMHSRYGRDALKMLSESCAKKDFTLGFYYSIMDWHHPDYIPRRKWEIDRPVGGAYLDRYITKYMKGQLEELIENYDPAILWFDGDWEHTREELHSAEIDEFMMNLKPELLFNDRLYSKLEGMREKGDFGTPENYVPATGIRNPDGSGRVWEACYTMGFNSWGYNPYETEFHSTAELIRMLIETVSKGGNLLLNVGPTSTGTIPSEFVDRLKGIGRWMKVNGESIYGTTASCFEKLPFFGRCTVKGNRLYLHVMGWPGDNILRIPGLETKIEKVYILSEPYKYLSFRMEENDCLITLPERAPDEIATVVAVELSGTPVVEQYEIKPDKDGNIFLPVYSAELKKRSGQRRAYLDHVYKTTLLVNWKNSGVYPEWNFNTSEDTKYEIKLSYCTPRVSSGKNFKVVIDNKEITGEFNKRTTGSKYAPSTFTIGEINLPSGKHNLRVEIINIRNNESMKLERVILVPVDSHY